MNAIWVAVEAFAEDHAIEGSVELDIDTNTRLFTLNLNVLDLWKIGLGGWPNVINVLQNCFYMIVHKKKRNNLK